MSHQTDRLRHPKALVLGFCLCLVNAPLQAEDLTENFDLAGNADLIMPGTGEPGYAPQAQLAVQQQGDNNLAHITQSGQALLGIIVQTGTDQEAYILQQGGNQMARIDQSGYGNSAFISQQGDSNQALIVQDGANNGARIEQTGIGRQGSIAQYGDQQQILVRQYQ